MISGFTKQYGVYVKVIRNIIRLFTQMSVTSDNDGLKLVGDNDTPGNTKYYGTDGSGTKGFYSIPAGGTGSCGITIDGQGGVISTGLKGFIQIPYSGTITGWHLFADVSGSIVIDIWKDIEANFPPTVADTIAGTEKPTLSSQQTSSDDDLTTWTKDVTAGDIIAFNVDSASTITRCTLTINILKT